MFASLELAVPVMTGWLCMCLILHVDWPESAVPSVTGQLCMCCIWHVWLVGIGGIRLGWSGVHVL